VAAKPLERKCITELLSCITGTLQRGPRQGFRVCSVADTVASGPPLGAQIGPLGRDGGCLEVTSLEGKVEGKSRSCCDAEWPSQGRSLRAVIDRWRPLVPAG